jgi:large subunit ribosomal protein L10
MNRETKETTVASLREMLTKVASLVVAEFRGLKVEDVNGLRREIRKNDCTYLVVKNTLFKRAIAGTAMEGMSKLFKGPTAIAFSQNDPVAAAKVMDKFCSTQEKLKIKGGFLDGQVLDTAGVKTLANMKGKDELRSELLATFMAPAEGFVRLIAASAQNFVYLLSARERALGENK